jgi:hypothetical protein
VAYGLVAALVCGLLVDRAPVSKGRLRAAADDVELPFHELVDERATGNSRCRPCPAVTRTYRGPDLVLEAALIEVASATANAGYPLLLTVEHRRTGRYESTNGPVRLRAVVTREGGERTEVELRFEGVEHPASEAS